MEKHHRKGGKKAAWSGKILENLLIKQFNEYKRQGLAYINKICDESLISKLETIYLKGVYNKKLRVDFLGYTKAFEGKKLTKSVFVGIEAKQTLKEYFSYNMIRPHQLDYLHRLNKAGGIAFLIIGFYHQNKIIRLFINDYTYKLINDTLNYNAKFSGGISMAKLFDIVGDSNIFDYENIDVLGILQMLNI